ncbi:MAG: 16S rRNA (cytidine(1402)-2'-O)-methyltransferase [Fervidobacterium sp.]
MENLENKYGILYVIGTPIGNLKDITFRAVEVLREVDYILAEDTRRTKILLGHYGIQKPLESFNEHNSYKKLGKVIEHLKSGKKIAQVSDAGMPVISDPGYNLVEACHKNAIPVEVVPGPSALTSALALSGFQGTHFYFIGFMPKDKNRRRLLRKIAQVKEYELIDTIVFFESPERLRKTLDDIRSIIGNCQIFIARELTKVHEEYFYGIIDSAIEKFAQVKGELTIIVKINDCNSHNEIDGGNRC